MKTVGLLAICLLASILSGAGEEPPLICTLVRCDLPDNLENINNSELETLARNSTYDLMYELYNRKANATLFVTGDMAREYRLAITFWGFKGFELALAGKNEDSADELKEAETLVKQCYVCDVNTVSIRGYLPPAGSQIGAEEAEGLGIEYVVGVEEPAGESGGLYEILAGSQEKDGREVPLDDRRARDLGLSGTEWSELLTEEVDERSAAGEPVVVIFTNHVTGTDEGYMEAYRGFLDHAAGKGARFLSAWELVQTAGGGRQL